MATWKETVEEYLGRSLTEAEEKVAGEMIERIGDRRGGLGGEVVKAVLRYLSGVE